MSRDRLVLANNLLTFTPSIMLWVLDRPPALEFSFIDHVLGYVRILSKWLCGKPDHCVTMGAFECRHTHFTSPTIRCYNVDMEWDWHVLFEPVLQTPSTANAVITVWLQFRSIPIFYYVFLTSFNFFCSKTNFRVSKEVWSTTLIKVMPCA